MSVDCSLTPLLRDLIFLKGSLGSPTGVTGGYNEVSVQETALLLTRPAKLHSLSESGGRRAGPYFLEYRVIKEA